MFVGDLQFVTSLYQVTYNPLYGSKKMKGCPFETAS